MSEQSQTVETPVEEHVLTQPAVGEQLRAARQARGLDLSDAAQMLKLGARQVEALEQGDWQGLPGQTFIRGFVRNYARILQIDPTPLMAELDKVLEMPVCRPVRGCSGGAGIACLFPAGQRFVRPAQQCKGLAGFTVTKTC